jgi:leucyl aminopeptidase
VLDSDVADMKNIGGRYGGASIAGLFLQEFVGDGIPWAHIDIAGPAFVDTETATERKGGTGYGVRTVLALLKAYKRPR